MRCRLRTWLALLLVGPTIAACGPQWRTARQSASDNEPSATPGKLVIEARSVLPADFTAGKPAHCTLVYAVFNNIDANLTGASLQIGPYSLQIPSLPAHAQFMEDLWTDAQPVNDSCIGTADGVARAASAPSAGSCSLSGSSQDDCVSRVRLVVDIDKAGEAEIAQAEATARADYAREEARRFEQAKAAAWAVRGPYQETVGSTLISATVGDAALSFPAITKQGYDPLAPTDVAAPASLIAFCPWHAPPKDAPVPPGRLLVLHIDRDPFGLADWYKLQVLCRGELDKMVWVRAPTVERLLKLNQLAKQVAAGTGPVQPPGPVPIAAVGTQATR